MKNKKILAGVLAVTMILAAGCAEKEEDAKNNETASVTENIMAKEYLLCYDLLTLNLDAFMKDYLPEKPDKRIYQEAALIWVNIKHNEGKMPDVDRSSYGISEETIERLRKFSRFPENYKNTYWYYYTYAAD